MGKPITTIEEAMNFIYSTTWKGSRLGLSRITELMGLMGNPQKKLKFVHIAGTNGKGSTAAMLASVLAQAGYKTGLYTSPFVHSFNELIQVNRVPIFDGELVLLADALQKFTAKMEDAPTEYEIITAAAMLHFYKTRCDIVVLEVGLGGRLDTTNVIDTPEVAVITSIGLDHMTQLGNTVEKIAGEKAGIIKQGGAVVCHPQVPSVEQVIREKCTQMNAPVIFVDFKAICPVKLSIDGQVFNYKNFENIKIPLLGEHQLRNAAVAIETLEIMRASGWKISQSALEKGLKNTVWIGRFEVMMKNPVFIVDVSHNPQGIQATLDTFLSLQSEFSEKKAIFIFGVLADKEYGKMAELLAPYAKNFILITPENPRALPATELERCIKANSIKNALSRDENRERFYAFSATGEIDSESSRYKSQSTTSTTVCETIEEGVKLALKTASKDDIICALGTLTTVGKIRNVLVDTTSST